MPCYVAFLRAINVGGRTVRMSRLRSLFEELGFASVSTFIASGNVLFASPSGNVRARESMIEGRLRKALGFEVATFVRTDSQVAAIAGRQPFSSARIKAAKALNVAFLGQPPPAARARALMALRTDDDDFHVSGTEVYWLCRKRQSESAISNAVLEKALQASATLRGVRTIARLAAMYSSAGKRETGQ